MSIEDDSYLQESAVFMKSETHGGEGELFDYLIRTASFSLQ